MDVFKFIDSCCSQAQLPYVRLITVYVHDGVVTNVCLARYNDKKIVKKACKVGLNEDRMMIDYGRGTRLSFPNSFSEAAKRAIGEQAYLTYNTNSKDLTIYRQ